MHMDRHSLVVGTNICIWIYILWRLLLIMSWFVVGFLFFCLLFTYNECIIFKLTCNYLPPVSTVSCLKYRCLIRFFTFLWIFFFRYAQSQKDWKSKNVYLVLPFIPSLCLIWKGYYPHTPHRGNISLPFFLHYLQAYWQ